MERFAVSFDPELARAVRDAAGQTEEGTVSAWLSEAARDKLRQQALSEAIREFEATNGVISEEEKAEIDTEWPA